MDVVKILMHSLQLSSCVLYKCPENPLELQITQEFTCRCGHSWENLLSGCYFLTIFINNSQDFFIKTFQAVYKEQISKKRFNLCEKESCEIRKSSRKFKITQDPPYIFFQLKWSQASDLRYIYMSIPNKFLLNEVFHTNLETEYKISMIGIAQLIYYSENGKWKSDTGIQNDYNLLTKDLVAKGKRIDWIMFEKCENLISGREHYIGDRSPISISKSEAFSKVTSNLWICQLCKASNESRNSCYNCNTSRTAAQERICVRCGLSTNDRDHRCYIAQKYSEEAKSVSITHSRCILCKELTLDGSLCTKCSKSRNESIANSSSTTLPSYTKSIRMSVQCRTCKKTIDCGICLSCDNKKTPIKKRPSSAISRKIYCYKCHNPLSQDEIKNCPSCFKKVNFPCTRCKGTGLGLNICDNCMKNYRASKN